VRSVGQGNLDAAARLAETHDLPISQARVHLAKGDSSAALALLEPVRHQAAAKGWPDQRLTVLVLEALALQAQGATDRAVQVLSEALALAAPEGFIRLFVDEGLLMTRLLSAAAARRIMPDTIATVLAACGAAEQMREATAYPPPALPARSLSEPLSQRELDVLHLMAQGLSNHQISERLFLAVSTVKGHNRNIFGKLQVQRRTEAVARARALGLV
jgi:LuxR family maltose regulon positive regulatory protein